MAFTLIIQFINNVEKKVKKPGYLNLEYCISLKVYCIKDCQIELFKTDLALV